MAEIHIGGDVSGQVGIGDEVEMVQASDRAAQPKAVVLFLAANPLETARLQLDEEARAIDRRLREGAFRDRLDFRTSWAVRVGDLQETLLRHRPAVVHFSGHGAGEGRLVFQAADGGSFVPEPSARAELFGILGEGVRCVVLAACHAEALAAALSRHVDCVVGTRGAMDDAAAVAFAAGFYRALSFGKSVSTAFLLGKNEIALGGLPDADVPQLVTGEGVDASRLTIV